MIITDRLVFIHLPKTGGTFVTRMIAELHLRSLGPLARVGSVRRIAGRLGVGFRDTNKHGSCDEIPPRDRGKPTIGCVRNPYARYVSRFEFGWWRRHSRPWWDWPTIHRRYPRFPDVSFAEFVDISSSMFHRLQASLPADERVGFYTEEFVRSYFRQPEEVLATIDDAYIERRGWIGDIHPVRLLRTENLNADLHRALLEVGYPASRIGFVLEAGTVSPPGGRTRTQNWESYYTPELKELVRQRERLLFELFPEYDH